MALSENKKFLGKIGEMRILCNSETCRCKGAETGKDIVQWEQLFEN
jgi:hypothetical protein